MIAQEIEALHRADKPIGIYGQAPSNYPGFAVWLVSRGIHSISLNPDTAIKTAMLIAQTEEVTGELGLPARTHELPTAYIVQSKSYEMS